MYARWALPEWTNASNCFVASLTDINRGGKYDFCFFVKLSGVGSFTWISENVKRFADNIQFNNSKWAKIRRILKRDSIRDTFSNWNLDSNI
jgi:hypothetical protein